MARATMPRLSPYTITDTLMRAELYREIRDAQEEPYPKGWTRYQIQPADVLMPELIAYKVWKLDTLKWVVLIAASLDDSRGRLEAGRMLALPTTAWIRDRILHYRRLEELGEGQ